MSGSPPAERRNASSTPMAPHGGRGRNGTHRQQQQQHPLWYVGSQRPINLLFGADYVALPAALNVRGCGAGRILRQDELRTAAERENDAMLRRVEFGNSGGLLHWTGAYKPWGDLRAMSVAAPRDARRARIL